MNPSAIWYPAPSAKSVSTLSDLAGLTLPSPPPEGALVYVGGAVNEYFRFSENSGAPINGTTVIQTMIGGASRWLKTSIVAGGGGGGAPLPIFIPFVATVATATVEGVFQRIGCLSLNMGLFPATIGALNRIVQFIAIFESSDVAITSTVKLKDVTNNVDVSFATFTTNSTIAAETSSVMTVGSAPGDIRDDVVAFYDVQLQMTGGGAPGTSVTCTNAYILIQYA